MAALKIERRGGLGGFGLPGSRVKSEGRINQDQLSEGDRRTVDELFAAAGKPAAAAHPDGFTYRITRVTLAGDEVIEVPESAVPPALAQAVRDELL